MLQIYPTHEVYVAPFGQNYSKFYEAFRQGVSTPQAPRRPAPTVPAKRPAAVSKQTAKRRRQNDRTSLPRSDQHHARTISAQRSAAITTKASFGARSNEVAPTSNIARESPMTPRPRSDSEAKGKSPGVIIVPTDPLYVFRMSEILFVTVNFSY